MVVILAAVAAYGWARPAVIVERTITATSAPGAVQTLTVTTSTYVTVTAAAPGAASPLVPRWSLIVIDILLFVLLCFLIHRVFSPVASGDFHLPHRDLGISMGSWVAVEPSGKGSHLCLRTRSPSGQSPHTGLRSREL